MVIKLPYRVEIIKQDYVANPILLWYERERIRDEMGGLWQIWRVIRNRLET